MLLRTLFFFFISLNLYAGPYHTRKLIETYPWLSGSPLTQGRNACFVCHMKNSDEHNNYGDHYFLTGWYTDEYSFKVIELLDSDEDGYTNIEELRSETNPGDPKHFPQDKNNSSYVNQFNLR